MREIIFRGQLRRKGEKVNMAGEPLPSIWKYGGVSQYGGGAMIYQAEPKIEKFPVYGDTVGQYTGLKDRHGKRIFVGDCFKTYCTELPVYRHIVGYYPEHFAFMARCIERNTVHYLSDYSPSVIEVIGNIYDNPELLEGEDNG